MNVYFPFYLSHKTLLYVALLGTGANVETWKSKRCSRRAINFILLVNYLISLIGILASARAECAPERGSGKIICRRGRE